jgi:Mn-containing catalase
MFFHDKRLQHKTKPDKADPIFAKKLQEVLGGQWGEMTVSMQYPFQGWNCRGPQNCRDMLLDIGTEEIAHVEMLATLIAQLLENPVPMGPEPDLGVVDPHTWGTPPPPVKVPKRKAS